MQGCKGASRAAYRRDGAAHPEEQGLGAQHVLKNLRITPQCSHAYPHTVPCPLLHIQPNYVVLLLRALTAMGQLPHGRLAPWAETPSFPQQIYQATHTRWDFTCTFMLAHHEAIRV